MMNEWLVRILRAILWLGLRLSLWVSLLIVAWWSAGAVLQWPAVAPGPADAVIVLGGGDGARYQKGRALILAGFAKTLMISHPDSAALKDSALRLRGVMVHTDKHSDSSWNEAEAMRRWMAREGIRDVLVVSDPPHLLRLSFACWGVFRGSGMSYRFIASEPPWWSAWRWWDNESAALFAGTEVMKFGYYLVRYRLGWGE